MTHEEHYLQLKAEMIVTHSIYLDAIRNFEFKDLPDKDKRLRLIQKHTASVTADVEFRKFVLELQKDNLI